MKRCLTGAIVYALLIGSLVAAEPAYVLRDDGLYVLKFRAAGHGLLALVAELVAGEIGRALGLPVPEIVLARLDVELSRTEPDPEIHALIHDSAGLNLALDYLPGSVSFDPLVHQLPADLASRIVWFDALVSNVDRTPRNTNMLMWHREPWLIDHGSSLYFHHNWGDADRVARSPFQLSREHILLPFAGPILDAGDQIRDRITPAMLDAILAEIPDIWLSEDALGRNPNAVRDAYRDLLITRLENAARFEEEAEGARAVRV